MCDVTAVRAVEAVLLADRLGARQHLALEVLGAQTATGSARSSSTPARSEASGHDQRRAAVSASSVR